MRGDYRPPARVSSIGSATSPATRSRSGCRSQLAGSTRTLVALLEDGRLFVIEYKGALRDPLDTAEKRTIGELWQRKSNGTGLFSVVEKSVNGKDMRRQLVERIGAA